jgi:RNA polymerase sigma-70 factor, ECF subfamily
VNTAGSPSTDALLLGRVADGDAEALRGLYDRYGAVLFALAHRTLGDRQLAEDCVQEVFVTAWRSAGRFDPRRASVTTWLFTIARNKSVDALRRRSRRPAEPLPERWPAGEAPDAAELVVANDQGRRVASALAELPQSQLEAVSLAYFEGLTQAEIAARLGVPLGTVKGRLRLALDRLRTVAPAYAFERDAVAQP